MECVGFTIMGSRRLRPAQPNNFEIITQDRLLGIYNDLFGTFFLVGLALSSVGLLVGATAGAVSRLPHQRVAMAMSIGAGLLLAGASWMARRRTRWAA